MLKVVQVFKTDVANQMIAASIILYLNQYFAHCRINFDLDDCDKVLRIENSQAPLDEVEIRSLIAGCGYHCEPLP